MEDINEELMKPRLDSTGGTKTSTILRLIRNALRFRAEDYHFKELHPDYEAYHDTRHISPLTDRRLALISGWIQSNSSVLDVGCGEGVVMDFLAETKNCRVSGIDTSKKAIEKLEAKGLEGTVRNVDEEGLGLASGRRYDYILFTEVLEHLKWPQNVLVEACRHVNKGVIVTLPNTGFIYWRLQLLRGYFPRQSFTHLRFWSIKDFRIFLAQLQLKPLALKTELPSKGVSGRIYRWLKNLLAYQQCWLVAPSW